MKSLVLVVLMLGVLLMAAPAQAEGLIRPKVVIVVTFEIGNDMGDKPGEFQFWVEREKLFKTMTVPGVAHVVRYNDEGTFGVVAGTMTPAGMTMMALALDPRFDFSHTYWIVGGIAGVNPEVASVGSAAWAAHVVNGDAAYEIDSREIPAEWPYGIIPIGAKAPNTQPETQGFEWLPPMQWTLNPALVQWAFGLTKDVQLVDTPEAQQHRALYTNYPEAMKPPSVLIGDSFATCRYWHGVTMAKWASDWDKLFTHDEGQFAMTNTDDQGIVGGLYKLSEMKKVDFQRVLVLRTGSNFCVPHPNQSAQDSMVEEYAGMIPALEAGYRTGSVVLHALEKNWSQYKDETPK